MAAVAEALEAGATTVGVRVELDHLAPAQSGPTWRSARCWSGVTGRRLQFAVRLHHDDRLVASGRITRVVVDTAAFLRDAGATR